MNDTDLPGYHGKIAGLGDFATRRLPRSFVEPWDNWLQNVLSCTREQLGDAWLETYLTSPLWRFALSPGVVGEGAWAGVLMPSVDRVGRYFPFSVVAPLPAGFSTLRAADMAAAWFEEAEQIVLGTLDDSFDIADLEEGLRKLGPPVTGGAPPATPPQQQNRLAWRFGLMSIDNLPSILPDLSNRLLGLVAPGFGVWWTQGSERVEPSVLVTDGLPPVNGFAALLDGNWERWGWDDGAPGMARMPRTSMASGR